AVSRPPGGGEESYTLTGFISFSSRLAYGDLVGRCLLALALMLIIAFFGAVLFAKKVTRPLEEELEREQVMEENQRLFFSAASHELKTPIAAARAMVEGMIAGVGDYKDHPKYLRECIRTLDSQSELVSEILELVKLDEKAETGALPLDLGELCGAVLAEYRPIAEQRGLIVETEIPPVKVSAGRQLLYRVFSNVLANAAQNTPAGGTIRVKAENQNKGIRLSILNTGAKIPDEVFSRLFEPFYRLDAARTRREGRSGLGLAIVKKALDRMKIPFTLENTADGVLFRMDLPCPSESTRRSVHKGGCDADS
ncbi:MAG: HAMP domain-containing histidine kinase, partial [Treponema sp.]|nr:HAMP domain-containing histidine kinase [Treponema sp.]